MIEDLLTKDLIAHYKLPDTEITPLYPQDRYFEFDDIEGQGLTLVSTGTAKFSNPEQLEITIIDYEHFFVETVSLVKLWATGINSANLKK